MLTICIPTIAGRESLLSRCLHSITEQAAGAAVEIIVAEGSGRLGDKVNHVAQIARGGWLTVVDDDDWLSNAYLAAVLPALDGDPDYVGLRVVEIIDGRYSRTVTTSGSSRTWDADPRLPVPKGITRTSIARTVPFGNHYTADRDWSAAVAAQIHRWVDVERDLYFYDYRPDASAFIGSGHACRDVGWWPFNESLIHRVRVDRT